MSRVVTIQAQQRWDYTFELRRTEASILVTLNELGQQGWELVNITYYKDLKGIMGWGAFLKRPSVTPSARSTGDSTLATQLSSTTLPTGKPPSPQGFDLSGDEFPLKNE